MGFRRTPVPNNRELGHFGTDSLDLFARHYQTNEPIPEALFKKMQASRNHLKALWDYATAQSIKSDLDLHIDWVIHEAEDLDAYLTDRLSSYQLKLNTPSLQSLIILGTFSVAQLVMLRLLFLQMGRSSRC